jgi:hypothetical protein
MCSICDGLSFDEVLDDRAELLARNGFALQGVVGPGGVEDPGCWVYTVGLLDRAAHPEMIIAGASLEPSASVLSALAQSVLGGERFLVGETIDLAPGIARVGAVHPIQYELGTFNVWTQLQHRGDVRARELSAVQIVLPGELSPFGEASWQPVLADRGARVDRFS